MKIRFGHRDVEFDSGEMGVLRDSNDLLGDVQALQQRMDEDGYLLLRNMIDRDTMRGARQTILEYMQEQQVLVPGTPVLEGVMPSGAQGVRLMGNRGVTHDPSVLAVLENPALFKFYDSFFGCPVRTFDYKWMRAVGNEQFTSAHMDVVYMGRGTLDLKTCWIPLGDVTLDLGPLAICVGSHNLDSFARMRETYGRMDVDRDRVSGWFCDEPMDIINHYGGQWCTSEFRAGDILTFGMYTIHASVTNVTNRYRLSSDVRFQPAHLPVDDRWVGKEPKAHYAWTSEPEKMVTMEVKKKEWGLT